MIYPARCWWYFKVENLLCNFVNFIVSVGWHLIRFTAFYWAYGSQHSFIKGLVLSLASLWKMYLGSKHLAHQECICSFWTWWQLTFHQSSVDSVWMVCWHTWVYVCLSFCVCVMISLKSQEIWYCHGEYMFHISREIINTVSFSSLEIFWPLFNTCCIFSVIYLGSIFCFGYPLTLCSSLRLFPDVCVDEQWIMAV